MIMVVFGCLLLYRFDLQFVRRHGPVMARCTDLVVFPPMLFNAVSILNHLCDFFGTNCVFFSYYIKLHLRGS